MYGASCRYADTCVAAETYMEGGRRAYIPPYTYLYMHIHTSIYVHRTHAGSSLACSQSHARVP